MAAVIAGCVPSAVPVSTVSPTDTREAQKATVEMVMVTPSPTATMTATPRPATLRPTPVATNIRSQSLSTPGVAKGTGSVIIQIEGEAPGRIEITHNRDAGIFFLLANGQREPFTPEFNRDLANPTVALEITTQADWSVKFLRAEPATATRRPTLKPTTVRSAPTIAVIPTKKPTVAIAPTVPPPTWTPVIAPSNCDPSYPDFCIPPPPPDLDCKDVKPHKRFRVLPPDPHGFDGDGTCIT